MVFIYNVIFHWVWHFSNVAWHSHKSHTMIYLNKEEYVFYHSHLSALFKIDSFKPNKNSVQTWKLKRVQDLCISMCFLLKKKNWQFNLTNINGPLDPSSNGLSLFSVKVTLDKEASVFISN